MADPGGILQQRIAELLQVAARIPGGIPGLTTASDDDLVDLLESAQLATQSLQGVLAATAGELARRSTGAGDRSLAHRLGWKTARGVLAAKAGISFGEAARLVTVGEAIRPNIAESGEDLPADRPHLATALTGGDLTVQAAQLIDQTLNKLDTRLDRDLLDALETTLVRDACSGRYSIAAFTTHCHEIVDQYDPASTKQRDDALRRVLPRRDPIPHQPPPPRCHRRGERERPRGPPRDEAAHPDGGQSPRVQRHHARRRQDAERTPGRGRHHDPGPHRPRRTPHRHRVRHHRRRSETDPRLRRQTTRGRSESHPPSARREITTPRPRRSETRIHQSATLRDPREPRPMRIPRLRHPLIDARIPPHQRLGHSPRTREGTDLTNGLPLCGFHNRLMEDGWTIELGEDRIPYFIPPATLDPQRKPLRGSSLHDRRAA